MDGREEVLLCDTVVLSSGVRPDRDKIAVFEDIAGKNIMDRVNAAGENKDRARVDENL